MEFACNKLQELIHSLNKDSKLEKWSSSVNEDGTLIKIKYQHRIPSETSSDTREKENVSSTGHKETESQLPPVTRGLLDTAPQSPEPNGASVIKSVFKPISNYHAKRDKKRLDNFKKKKILVPDKHMQLRSESKVNEVEIRRRNDSENELLSNISPEKPVVEASFTSPWADKNPFSLLQDEYPSPPVNCPSEQSDSPSGPDEDLYSEGKSDQKDTILPSPSYSISPMSAPNPSTLTSPPASSSSDAFTEGLRGALIDPSVRKGLVEAFRVSLFDRTTTEESCAEQLPHERKDDESIT